MAARVFSVLLVPIAAVFILKANTGRGADEPIVSHQHEGTLEKLYRLSINNGLITLDAYEADVAQILEEISNKAHIELKIGSQRNEKITISFKDLQLDEALKKLSANHAIVYQKSDGQDEYRVASALVLDSLKVTTVLKTGARQEIHNPPDPHSKPNSGKIDRRHSHYDFSSAISTKNKIAYPESKYVPNELVVRFSQDLSEAQKQALIVRMGATVKSNIQSIGYAVLSLPQDLPVDKALAFLRQKKAVERAEPNYLIPIQELPNDPGFLQQWALYNTGQTGGADDADIDAAEAWDVEQGSEEVVIAIIDTGVDYTHEDLAANIWKNPREIPDNGVDDDDNGYVDDVRGWDFVDSFEAAAGEDFTDQDNDPTDRHGHGTHVAGIAAAVSNNAIGVAGVAGNCKIMPVRAGYKTVSGGGVLESDDAARAIVYAAENGAKVINLSWGDYQKSNLIEDAMTFATDKGSLICAAAGNENSTNFIYPAASQNHAVISVGATDIWDRKASFSNYGPWVDVSAPGVGIYSTYINNSYQIMSGTSMAAPHVAGVAALVFSHFEGISSTKVKNRIMRSVDVSADLIGTNSTSGRINAYSALTGEYSSPHIFSLSQTSVHEGDELTLIGDNFGSNQGGGKVQFYPGVTAEILSWSDSVIMCRVPNGTQTGYVTVESSGGTSNGIEIIILIKYYEETLIDNEFLAAGQAQGWKADDQSWLYQLPFSFPFFGEQYDRVYVCSNGFLDFENNTASYLNSSEAFKHRVMIAPLWDDLTTTGYFQPGEDIYIHSPSLDSVSIRWVAERYETRDPVNVEVILYDDGRIKFNYGSGNINLSPTIGLSGSDKYRYNFSTYDEASRLNDVQTILFTPKQQSFSIQLDLGWNLISLPFEPVKSNINHIMGSAISGIESIWGYIDGKWLVHNPADSEASNFDTMKAGYGYWVKTNQTGLTIQFAGQVKATPIQFTAGWNLIGICSLQNISSEETLKNIWGTYEIAWGYNNGSWQVRDTHYPGLSDLLVLEPGKGYWVKFSH